MMIWFRHKTYMSIGSCASRSCGYSDPLSIILSQVTLVNTLKHHTFHSYASFGGGYQDWRSYRDDMKECCGSQCMWVLWMESKFSNWSPRYLSRVFTNGATQYSKQRSKKTWSCVLKISPITVWCSQIVGSREQIMWAIVFVGSS